MINELRTILQEKLLEITGLDCGVAKPDDVIENNEIYYGYELTYRSHKISVDYSTTDYDIVITGRLVGKGVSLTDFDSIALQICEVLKSLRFDYTCQDTLGYDNVKKRVINGNASMTDATHFIR